MDELMQKYGNKLASYDVFKGFTLEGKWVLLQHWRSTFGNKKVREAWGLNPAAYYAVTNRIKVSLRKKGIDPDKVQSMEDYAMPGSTQRPKNGNGRREVNVIEAEFSVKDDAAPTPPPSMAAIEAAAAVQQPVKEERAVVPMINFDISDDAARISERMSVIATLLLLEKGPLRVKIEVFKGGNNGETT